MEWRAPEDQIRAALDWKPDPPQTPTLDQAAYLLAQGYLPHGDGESNAQLRTRALDERMIRRAPAD